MKKRSPKRPKFLPLHPELANWTSFLLVEAGNKTRSLFSHYLVALDIETKQFGMLFALTRLGPLSQVELGQHMGIDRAPMVQHIDHLEQHGLVKRTPSPRDRRAHEIVLTDKGREVFAQALELAHQVQAEILAPLSSQEQAQLNHLMNQLLASHFINDNNDSQELDSSP